MNLKPKSSLPLAFAGISVLLIVGCSRSPAMVPVEGVVIYKGKPLEYGSVMFQPVGVENGKVARSQIREDGTFALSTEAVAGAMAGTYWVGVTAFEAQRTNSQASKTQELALGKSAVPSRFNRAGSSGIEINVAPDMELPITIDLDKIK